MNIKEALQTAIKYETKVRDAYRKALGLGLDEKTDRLMRLLASQEHDHLEDLRTAYAKLSATGKLDRFDVRLEQQLEAAHSSLQRVDEQIHHAAAETRVVKILGRLVKVEEETAAYYRNLCRTLPPHAATYFERFVLVEEMHLALINDRLRRYFIPER